MRLRGVYEIAAVGVSGSGWIDLTPAPPEPLRVWVDGNPAASLPAKTSAGLHLVQVVEDQQAVFHDLVVVPEDSTVTVAFELPEVEPDKGRKTKLEPGQQTKKLPIFLIGAGAAGALSGASALGALSQNGAMRNATTEDQVEAAYGRQVGFAVTSYTLLGAAATGVVLHVAL